MKYRTINNEGTLWAISSVTGLAEYVTSTNHVLNTTAGGGGASDVNLVSVSGSPITLGQTTMSASLPVTLASNQSALSVTQGTSPWIVAGAGTAGTAATGVVTIQGIASMTPVQVSQATASNLNATVSQATGTNLHTVVDSGTITANPTTPTTLVAFLTTVTTAGTRVQLGSNAIVAGILEAPSTNTGKIYVGGSAVSSTVYGSELQPGQSVGIQIDNTNKLFIDSSVNGDKCSFLGS